MPERPETEWSASLVTLVTDLLGSTQAGPELDLIIATIDWLRQHPPEAHLLIGNLAAGY